MVLYTNRNADSRFKRISEIGVCLYRLRSGSIPPPHLVIANSAEYDAPNPHKKHQGCIYLMMLSSSPYGVSEGRMAER